MSKARGTASTASESTKSDGGDGRLETGSVDSSFYGSYDVRREYERRARDSGADVDCYRRVHEWNVQVIAARAVRQNPGLWMARREKRKRDEDGKEEVQSGRSEKKSKLEKERSMSTDLAMHLKSRPIKLYNPYEGSASALQIDESVDAFLQRLKPASTELEEPWIYCANFRSDDRPTDSDIAGFKQIGFRLLDRIKSKRAELEARFDPPKTEGAITRMMTADRANLEFDIMVAAKKHGVTNGKWMLFPTRDKVDQYWSTVVRATVEGRLGSAAKVATMPEERDVPTQVICVYTDDMSDRNDIKRVLLELVRLKLAPPVLDQGSKRPYNNGQIWYKPDCYTYLDILRGNEYKIKPTLYGTSSLLSSADI